jgi:hypothetical protein
VEIHLQPVRIVNELAFPDVGNLTHIAIKVIVVIEAVQRQTMPPDTAKAMIQAAFPTIPLPVIDAMFAPLGVAPTPPPPDQMPPDQSAIPPEAPQPEPNLTI